MAHRNQRHVLLLDHQFIFKGCINNSGAARWGKCRGQGMEKWLRAAMPSPGVPLLRSPHAHQRRNSPTLFLWDFYKGFIASTQLIKLLAIDCWFNPQPRFTPQALWGEGTESSNPLLSWQPAPFVWWGIQKSPH